MKGWRTLLINSGVAVLGVLTAFDWTSITTAKTAGIIIAAVGFGNMALRAFTNTAVGSSS